MYIKILYLKKWLNKITNFFSESIFTSLPLCIIFGRKKISTRKSSKSWKSIEMQCFGRILSFLSLSTSILSKAVLLSISIFHFFFITIQSHFPEDNTFQNVNCFTLKSCLKFRFEKILFIPSRKRFHNFIHSNVKQAPKVCIFISVN